VRLWDPVSGQARKAFRGHKGPVNVLAFSPDGDLLASAGDDRVVRLWDAGTGRARGELEGHTDRVNALAFSPDGALLASAGSEGVVRLWDPTSGQPISGFATGHSLALAWSAGCLAVAAERSVIVLHVCEP